MNKTIKHSLWALALPVALLLGLTACENTSIQTQGVEAVVIGADLRLCACCGGYLVALGNDPNPPFDSLYQWDATQAQVDDLPPTDSLPHFVRIDYTLDTARCNASLGWIDISSIEVLD